MKKLVVALLAVVTLTLATAAPAFAIVHRVNPICEAIEHAGLVAGGAPAADEIKTKNPVFDPPLPAK